MIIKIICVCYVKKREGKRQRKKDRERERDRERDINLLALSEAQ